MDFGELGQDADEKVIVPTGLFQFAPHGSFAGFQSGQVKRQFPQQGQVLGTVPLTVPRLVLVAGYVQYPVQPVLNAPMTAGDVVESFRWENPAQQVVASFLTGVAVFAADCRNLAHGLQARPVM